MSDELSQMDKGVPVIAGYEPPQEFWAALNTHHGVKRQWFTVLLRLYEARDAEMHGHYVLANTSFDALVRTAAYMLEVDEPLQGPYTWLSGYKYVREYCYDTFVMEGIHPASEGVPPTACRDDKLKVLDELAEAAEEEREKRHRFAQVGETQERSSHETKTD